MKDLNENLKEYVLGAISDDYESLETVLSDVNDFAAECGTAVDPQRVVKALGELISEGYAQAYMFSGTPWKPQPTTYSSDRIGDLWFYVTPEGKQLAKHLQEE